MKETLILLGLVFNCLSKSDPCPGRLMRVSVLAASVRRSVTPLNLDRIGFFNRPHKTDGCWVTYGSIKSDVDRGLVERQMGEVERQTDLAGGPVGLWTWRLTCN